jgi:RHS repeat-associated protein
MAYNAVNQLTGLSRFSGVNGVVDTNYVYDNNQRLIKLAHVKGASTVASYDYSYDNADKLASTISSVDGTSNYSYDATNQLTGASHTAQTNEAYAYDANGNRTSGGTVTGVNNQLLNDGTYSYTYDGEGNRTRRTEIATGKVTEYIWDYRNRLASVLFKDGAGVVTKTIDYIYDGNNQRIGKRIDGAVTERYVIDKNQIALVFDGAGTQTHRYLYGTQVDQVLADEMATGMVWALADNQGTVKDLVDNSGVVVNHVTYDSFGRVVAQSNAGVEFRYGYTGRETDGETGLDYYRARYYDAENGRFISEDPIGFNAGDGNLTRYVGNSPVNWNDPSGLEEEVFPGENFFKGLVTVGTVLGSGAKAFSDGAGQAIGDGINAGIDWSTRPGGWANGGAVSDGIVPNGVKQKTRGNPEDANPNYGVKNPSVPLPNRPNNTGNTAPRPQHNPNDVHNIPPFVVPHKPHTGHEGCKPDWLPQYIFNSKKKDIYLGDGYSNSDGSFHDVIKKKVLTAVGTKKYAYKVGNNPDIKVVNGEIILTGSRENARFKGKNFPTGLQAEEFFGNNDQ